MASEFHQIFLGWVDQYSVARKVYATEMSGSGFIRPWQCSWRGDFGVSSMVDPDQAEALIEVFLQEGLLGACHVEVVIHILVHT